MAKKSNLTCKCGLWKTRCQKCNGNYCETCDFQTSGEVFEAHVEIRRPSRVDLCRTCMGMDPIGGADLVERFAAGRAAKQAKWESFGYTTPPRLKGAAKAQADIEAEQIGQYNDLWADNLNM